MGKLHQMYKSVKKIIKNFIQKDRNIIYWRVSSITGEYGRLKKIHIQRQKNCFWHGTVVLDAGAII